MKTVCKITFGSLIILLGTMLLSSFADKNTAEPPFKFPYKQAGLTERQAAAHLLNRFTFGPRTTDVDAVIDMGLEHWFLVQLEAKLPDDSLNKKLGAYDALELSNTEVVNTYPKKNKVLRMAIAEGVIDQTARDKTNKGAYKSELAAYMQEKGYKPQKELYRQFANQKILRAAYSNNQLQELLTDFWFNHFNVSLDKNQCAEFIPAYERDVIRPNVLGKFEDLLLATAQSPAMLMYLDNSSSTGVKEDINNAKDNRMKRIADQQMEDKNDTTSNGKVKKPRKRGLNENYAREVMELHTLGVDGGYTQQDVTQAARVLTGWTIYPMNDKGYGAATRKSLDNVDESKLKRRGFVHHGDFLFAANRHDTKEKTVLGRHFPAGGGYEEGVELLKMFANHPSTAKFICRKIAVRFVNDHPSQSLVDKMVKTFEKKNGDIGQVLITMVSSDEFWSKEALREKTKSPFELAISAVRGLNADISQPYQLYNWIAKMGQKMYYYQAPTGFPDKAEYWINTGALLNRMNFGLALASQRIPGISINLARLNQNHEPESAEAALVTYSKMIMPERDLSQTITRLKPMLNEPDLATKVEQAAQKSVGTEQPEIMMNNEKPFAKNNAMLAQVVGVIIGSPEFQRK
ncbi:DUF1800 domain-containing protein [Dyadobacter sp. CY107]|uniref:DUF1800 domain-containing protein n=1 Tax=Dyadobacter fanqingshengii TaxID=2906443 RepID=UPI001F254FC7|nr:DUF1800 domain-containing protein [Dyadobacter fanqingshengii]MCF2504741.1 DUF1800 domain-containing protein [Dyadobacter fanqingshengii]